MTASSETRLADLSEVISIGRGLQTQDTLPDGELPVLSVADLRGGVQPRRFADRAKAEAAGVAVPEPGTVLLTIEGGTVGEAHTVGELRSPFIPSQQAAAVCVVDPSRLDPWYLGAWLTTQTARERLRRLGRGTTIQRIPVQDLWSLTVPTPPVAVQRDIGKRFRAFEAAIAGHRAVASCLDELRDVDIALAFSAL